VRSSPEASSRASFAVKFFPYQLNQDVTAEGEDKRSWYREQKFAGSEARTAAFEHVMDEMGKPLGVNFTFGGMIANTLDAHRVLQYVQETKGPAAANRLVDALYRLYFEEEQHPSSEATLLKACKAADEAAEVEAGSGTARIIGEEEARHLVVEDKSEGLADVKMAIREQNLNGVDAVPHIMFEGRRRDLTLIGAKEIDDYVKAMETIIKESV